MNISIVGSKSLAKELGKKGTTSDITLYNTSFQGRYFTFIEPEKYPEKIQPLFQSINMSQFSILFVQNDLPKNILGECILALDTLKMRGIIVLNGTDENEIKQIIKDTSLKDFPIILNDTVKIMEFLSSIEIKKGGYKPKVVLDHAFLVKSVGTVALGTVMSGEIKKHDNLTLYPVKKNVLIKSVQMHDKDFDKAGCGDRVGLSLKGVEVEDLGRGSIFSDKIGVISELKVNINKNRFFKEDNPNNVMCLVGLQYVSSKLENDKLIFNSEIAIDNDQIILLTPDRQMRIFGLAQKIDS